MIDSPAHKGKATRSSECEPGCEDHPHRSDYPDNRPIFARPNRDGDWVRLDDLGTAARQHVMEDIQAGWFWDEIKRLAEALADHVAAHGGLGARSWAEEALRHALDGVLPSPPKPEPTPAELERRKMTQVLRRKILERDEYRCQLCGDHKRLVVDHIIAVCNGGLTEEANLQALCAPCNRQKGTT